jgi:hypothetical protein
MLFPTSAPAGKLSRRSLSLPPVTEVSGRSMSLISELERLADAIGGEPGAISQVSLPSIADRIGKSIGVKAGEVAILGVSVRWRHLHFLVPDALKKVGFIPLSSKTALAARTARDSRPEIINDFPEVMHATVFEGVKTASTEPAEVIQKIISAPILNGDKVVGVIQISRKGMDKTTAGPDFTPEDLGKVLALCRPLGKLLQHLAGE